MVGRVEKVTVGGTVTKGLDAAGAVGPSGCVAGGAVGTVEVSRVRGCGAGGATKVARLAEAGVCRAAEATEVARWARARGCCVAGATRAAELGGAGCWGESPERKEAWPRSATTMAAAVERS